jgi:hypothetical protein
MTFGDVRKDALERWKRLADPCSHGQLVDFPDSGQEAPLVWQFLSYPISCQWQARSESEGFGHISIFCSLWEWASNLTDTLLDHRFDDYPIGELKPGVELEIDDETKPFLEHFPEVLARHYFRTLLLAAEILEDLTILRNTMHEDSRVKKTARSDLSQAPLSVDALAQYVNRICKHKEPFHKCNHHIPKRFLDGIEDFDPTCYDDWKFLTDDFIEIPRYQDIIQTVIGAFSRVDALLRDSEKLDRVGRAFGIVKSAPDGQSPTDTDSRQRPE